MVTTSWPFDQLRNCVVIVAPEVFSRDEPILPVTHDVDDHGWQFAGLTDSGPEKARVMSLAEVVETDSPLFELCKLPVGWHARRRSVKGPWILEPLHDNDRVSRR